MISKEWETGLKPTQTLFSCLQFNTLTIYIQLPWSWKTSFTPCFRISACRVNRKKWTRTHNDTFPLILFSKMGKELFVFFFYFIRKHYVTGSCISISLYLAFQKNHVKALEKDVLYSKLHWHILSVSLVLGLFYFNYWQGFFCLWK